MLGNMIGDHDECYFCRIRNITDNNGFRRLIESHHIKEQNQGGSDTPENIVPICSNCHSKVHLNVIKIDKWYFTTAGWRLHWWDENGKEIWGKKKSFPHIY